MIISDAQCNKSAINPEFRGFCINSECHCANLLIILCSLIIQHHYSDNNKHADKQHEIKTACFPKGTEIIPPSLAGSHPHTFTSPYSTYSLTDGCTHTHMFKHPDSHTTALSSIVLDEPNLFEFLSTATKHTKHHLFDEWKVAVTMIMEGYIRRRLDQ